MAVATLETSRAQIAKTSFDSTPRIWHIWRRLPPVEPSEDNDDGLDADIITRRPTFALFKGKMEKGFVPALVIRISCFVLGSCLVIVCWSLFLVS